MLKLANLKRSYGRYGAASMVIMLGLFLAACSAKGKGTLAPNTEGTPVETGLVFNLGKATFEFDLTCGVVNGKPKVEGSFKYNDQGATLLDSVPLYGPVKFDGRLEILTVTLKNPDGTTTELTTSAEGCDAYDALNNPAPGSVAQFLGVYTTKGKGPNDGKKPCPPRGKHDSGGQTCPAPGGRECPNTANQGCFNLLVFDQGGTSSSFLDLTGDAFSLELIGGPYSGYTRAGYIERGDIKVRD